MNRAIQAVSSTRQSPGFASSSHHKKKKRLLKFQKQPKNNHLYDIYIERERPEMMDWFKLVTNKYHVAD